MKLVDILARELKVWPEGVFSLSQLQHNGAIINGKGYDGREWDRLQIADDTPPAGVLVTEDQWQAAVDALKASENAVPEWNGEGLPPVGTVCAVLNSDLGNPQWERCTILYSGKHRVVYDSESCEERVAFIEDLKFRQARPIRTPEQIAAEEIQKIRDEIKWQKPRLGPCPVEQMYLLGYRKFEIVDN